ncbi:MAG: hypothetical protein KH549_02310 [Clostridium sp.]|nr:hypothetical protein [Clostridium sp.]
MKFLRKLERNFGKYAVPNLMYYIILMYGAGIVIDLVMPGLYYQYLCLDAAAILRGQVWRLVTFLICPPSSGIFFNLIAMFLYYSLGTTLERVWGTFRFNLYFFSGILFHIIAAFVIYFFMGVSVPLTPFYLNNSLFLAFAATFPQMQFYLYGLLPIRAYWLGIFIGAEFLYEFLFGGLIARICIGLALLNFVIFFMMTRNYSKISPREIKRKQKFKSDMKTAQAEKIRLTHHKCAVCGRTEKDDPNLEFRYCSKCEGNLEYCMDHLYTHKHVTKEDLE